MKSSTMKSSMKKSSIERVVAPVVVRARGDPCRTIGRARVGTTASPSTLPFAVRVFDGLFALKFESVSRSSDSKIRSSDSKIRRDSCVEGRDVDRDRRPIAVEGLVVVRSAGLSSFGVAGPAGRGARARWTHAGGSDGGARIARLVVSARLACARAAARPERSFPVPSRPRASSFVAGGVRQVKSSRRRAPCVRLGSDGGALRRGGSHEHPPERTPEKRTHAIASAIKPASPLVRARAARRAASRVGARFARSVRAPRHGALALLAVGRFSLGRVGRRWPASSPSASSPATTPSARSPP